MREESFKLSLKMDGFNKVRGTNEIIIYTYDKKNENNETGTNEYGYELAIDENSRVCEKGTHVKFHEQGMIISAHGINGDLLADKIQIGDRISYSNETRLIVFIREMKDVLFRLENDINKAKNKLQLLKNGLYDVNINRLEEDFIFVQKQYQEINRIIKTNKKVSKTLLQQTEEALYNLNIKMVPSIVVESRGLWHRPNIFGTEHTVQGIKNFLKEIKDVGFNSVYVETFWWGRSISNSTIVSYHPRVKEGDYGTYDDFLQAFIDIAHQLDIEVHAWTETFFIGGEKKEEVPPWINGRKHWLNTTYHNDYIQSGKGTEEGFIFLDPSNQEVKEFLISYYQELATYPLDGIQFDYIRYPHENDLESSSGYTENAMNLFKEKMGINKDVDLRVFLRQDEKLYDTWKDFRRNHVSDFMQKAVKAIKKVNSTINISIAVGSDPDVARNVLLQDWPTWVQNGLIDIICPMAYSRDINYIKDIVKKMNGISRGLTYNYTGIGTFMEFPEFENVHQIIASRQEKGLGAVLFASQYIINHENMQKVLKNGIYSKKAVTPNSPIKTILKCIFTDILDKIDRRYMIKKDFIEETFNEIRNQENINEMMDLLNQIILNVSKHVKDVNAERIIDDLKYLKYILKIKLNNEEKKR